MSRFCLLGLGPAFFSSLKAIDDSIGVLFFPILGSFVLGRRGMMYV
jgi:hypothetical protein